MKIIPISLDCVWAKKEFHKRRHYGKSSHSLVSILNNWLLIINRSNNQLRKLFKMYIPKAVIKTDQVINTSLYETHKPEVCRRAL